MPDKGLADYAESYSERRYGKLGGQKILERESKTYIELLEFLGAQEKDKILELGSNDAVKSEYLSKKKKFLMTAADAEEEAIEKARKNGRAKEYHIVDAHQLPFEENSFDYVIIPRMLHLSVIDEEKVLEEAFRVSRKGLAFDVFRKPSLRVYNSFMHLFDRNMPASDLTSDADIFGAKSINGWIEDFEVQEKKTVTDFLIPFGAFKFSDSSLYVEAVEKVNKFFRKDDRPERKITDLNSVIYVALKK